MRIPFLVVKMDGAPFPESFSASDVIRYLACTPFFEGGGVRGKFFSHTPDLGENCLPAQFFFVDYISDSVADMLSIVLVYFDDAVDRRKPTNLPENVVPILSEVSEETREVCQAMLASVKPQLVNTLHRFSQLCKREGMLPSEAEFKEKDVFNFHTGNSCFTTGPLTSVHRLRFEQYAHKACEQ